MKKIILAIALLFSAITLNAQDFGGTREIRVQAVGGFQNGVGLDVEYLLPYTADRLAVRLGYGMLPFTRDAVEFDDLKGDFEYNSGTIDFGLKYYFSGRKHGMFLGLDFAMDTKKIDIEDIVGVTKNLKGPDGSDLGDQEITVYDGEASATIKSTMITPKFGWTKISKSGFTWSIELGYSLITVDPTTVLMKDERPNEGLILYNYTYDNIYESMFNMSGLPYLRVGVGYAIKLTRNIN